MRFRILVNGFFREKGKGTFAAPDDYQVAAIAPGETTDWQSERAMSVGQLEQIFKKSNDDGKITFLVASETADRFFKLNREIPSLIVDIQDISTKRSNLKMKATDLKVIKTQHLSSGSLPKDSVTSGNAATLTIGDSFTRVVD